VLSLSLSREKRSIGVDDAVSTFGSRVGQTGFHVANVIVDVVRGDLFVFRRTAHID
jgi:hypothetical protein